MRKEGIYKWGTGEHKQTLVLNLNLTVIIATRMLRYFLVSDLHVTVTSEQQIQESALSSVSMNGMPKGWSWVFPYTEP